MEDATLKISQYAGMYALSGAQRAFEHEPQTSAGILANRVQRDPSVVDTESQLRNQFDIIGRTGYVDRRAEPVAPEPARPSTAPAAFFEPITDRAARRHCDAIASTFRIDPAAPPLRAPAPTRVVDTRQIAKDEFKATCAHR